MTQLISGYKLTQYADNDLVEIFVYTQNNFNQQQAIKYLTALNHLFKKLTQNPHLGKKRDEIKKELRSIPLANHIIFYRIQADHIIILRVLHGSKDITQQLFKKVY